MPLYEFRCEKCGREFEELIRSAEQEAALRCPACDAARLVRKPSVFAAHAASAPLPRAGGCGRCGDPNGPCGLDE
jgi:putative FmdB family regulatory protein